METKYPLRYLALELIFTPVFWGLIFEGPKWMNKTWWIIAIVATFGACFLCAVPYIRACWTERFRNRNKRARSLVVPDDLLSSGRALSIGRYYRPDAILLLIIVLLVVSAAFGGYRYATWPARALDLKFFASRVSYELLDEGGPTKTEALVINANFTNRSSDGMSLIFMLTVRYPRSGEVQGMGLLGQWFVANSPPTETANVPPKTSVDGRLIFRLVPIRMMKKLVPELTTIDSWDQFDVNNFALRIEDKISGACDLSSIDMYPSKTVWSSSEPSK